MPVSLIVGAALAGGCTKVCSDDGFAWQQDPLCVAQLTATESAGTETATDPTEASSEPTESNSETNPTTSGGDGLWCSDKDKDGFGDPADCAEVPPGGTPPDGSVNNDGDCDDANAKTFPGSAPNDDPTACMTDEDDDDWGDADVPGGGGGGGPVAGTDCDDASDKTFPGAAPNDDATACMKDADEDDWGDNDPQGSGGASGVVAGTDCDDDNMSAWLSCGTCMDQDGDGWLSNCDAYPPDFPTADCDDADPDTFPGAAPNDDPNACMKDGDGDDWGDDAPSNPEVTPGTDCDDESATTFTGSASKDDPAACTQDADGDGHGDANPDKPGVDPGSDCFDANPMLNPSNNVLLTAPLTTGEMLEVDLMSGTLSPYAMVDVQAINPWIPTSVAVNPVDGTIYAALAFKDRLATMNYCGAGVPTLLPAAHKKSLCGIGFDSAGNLHGVDGQVDQFLTFNADGSISPDKVKSLTFMGKTLNVADCGMAYDCHEDRLLVSDSGSAGIYTVNPADGAATRLADLPAEMLGSGLEYDSTTKQVLSCDQTSLLSIAIDGSNDFTKLADLAEPADDLVFGPKCN